MIFGSRRVAWHRLATSTKLHQPNLFPIDSALLGSRGQMIRAGLVAICWFDTTKLPYKIYTEMPLGNQPRPHECDRFNRQRIHNWSFLRFRDVLLISGGIHRHSWLLRQVPAGQG